MKNYMHITLLFSILQLGLLYPESGLHLRIGTSGFDIPKNKWIPLQGWEEKIQEKGFFIQTIKIHDNSFIAPKSGLYYVALFLHFERLLTGSCFINITSSKITYLSRISSKGKIYHVHLNDIMKVNRDDSVSVYFFSSAFLKLTAKSRLTIQFVSYYEQAIGFVAQPSISKTLKHNKKRQLTDWTLNYGLFSGFSHATGSYIIPLDGCYLVVFKFLVSNISGGVNFIVSVGDEEIYRKKEIYKSRNEWETVTYTGVHKFSSKSKITLNLVTNWGGGYISNESSYSILFLSPTTVNSNVSLNSHLAKKVEYDGGKLSKIAEWQKTDYLDFYQGGYHLKKTGYYFVILSTNMWQKHSDNVSISLTIDDTITFEESVISQGSNFELSISGVFFLKDKESIYCYIKSRYKVSLLRSTMLTVYELKFRLSSLFTMSHHAQNFGDNKSSMQINTKNYLSMTKELGMDFLIKDFIISQNYLEIMVDGIYFVSLSGFIEDAGNDSNHLCLMHRKNETEIWMLVSTCHAKRFMNCLLSVVLYLQKNNQLSILKQNGESVVLSKHSSIELYYIKPLDEAYGFSHILKTELSPKGNKKQVKIDNVDSTEQNTNPFFTKDLMTEKEHIKIAREGLYIIICNIIVHVENSRKSSIGVRIIHKSKRRKRRIFYYEGYVSSKSTMNLPFFAAKFLDTGDDIQILVSLNNGHSNTQWHIDKRSIVSLFLVTRSKTHFLLVEHMQNARYDSRGSVKWKQTPTFFPKGNNLLFEYLYDIEARSTFAALITVSLHGKIIKIFGENSFIELSLLLKDTNIWPHLVSTIRKTSLTDSVFLQLTGVVVLHPSDVLKVNLNMSDGIEFEALRGSTFSLIVLEDGAKHTADWSYYSTNNVFTSKSSNITSIDMATESGLYMIHVQLQSSKLRKRKDATLESKLTAQVDDILTSDNVETISVYVYPINQTLLNITCTECEVGLTMMSVLSKNAKIMVDDSNYAVTSNLHLLGTDDPNFSLLHRKEDMEICNFYQKVDVIGDWYNEDKMLKGNVLYRAAEYEFVYMGVNIFTQQCHENGSVVLALDGQPYGGMELVKKQYSPNGYHYELSSKIYLKRGQTIQLMFMCSNLSYIVMKNSDISIFKKETQLRKVTPKFPTFEVQPLPKLTTIPYKFNYTCSTGDDDEDIQYSWNRIDLFTGALDVNISTEKYITVNGLPEESGHYYCTAFYDGFESQSDTATLDIQDDNECDIMKDVNNTMGVESCHEYANCTNTIGSYYCECFEGFRGDGYYHCEDINECIENNTCGNNSICENSLGSFTCTCESGFSGIDGRNCSDINECMEYAPDHCETLLDSNHTACENMPGSYDCVCTIGYIKKNEKCIDQNECESDPEDYPCHEHAGCINTEGSFTCQCDIGWQGNGTYCEDIDECEEKIFSCAGNASCVNLPGSYRCICDSGFKGDGAIQCLSLGCFPPRYCTGQYVASWWSRKPYIETGRIEDSAAGLFRDILMLIVTDVCRNCSEIKFSPPLNGSTDLELKVEANDTDFACPLYGSKDQEKFRGHPFIPIVESPGVAFFVKEEEQKDNPLLGSLAGSWPILVITLLLASLSGVIIWFLDTVRNPKEFPRSFLAGSWEGFWWAFITMTTVGYGDKAPRSFFARVFGIVWILVGLVIISTFTATITTVLTASSLANEAKLYGTKVGALTNSEEFRLGVKRNADVRGYASVPDIIEALHLGEIQGALLDTYIAGEFQDDLGKYKLQEILEHVFVYGVVLSRDAGELESHFRSYLERKQGVIYNTISKVVKPLKETKASIARGGTSSAIFDADSEFFIRMLIGGGTVLGIVLMAGFVWDFFYWRKKRKLSEKRKSKEVHTNGHTTTTSCKRWNTADIIEYQRKAFKHEVTDLRGQINKFSEVWVDRLDEIEQTHEEQLNRVEKWLGQSTGDGNIRFNSARSNGDMRPMFGSYDEDDV